MGDHDPQTARRPSPAEGAGEARRSADRPLLLDAREGQPGGDRPPRGRERLHRRGHGADRGAARAALPRDRRPGPGDRHLSPVLLQGLLDLHPDRRRPGLRDLLPPARHHGRPRAGRCSTATSWPAATTTSTSGSSRPARTRTCSPTRPTTQAPSFSSSAFATWRRATTSRTCCTTSTTAPPGRATTRPSSTSKADAAMRPFQVWRHRLGTAADRRRARAAGGRRALRAERRADQERALHHLQQLEPGDRRNAASSMRTRQRPSRR